MHCSRFVAYYFLAFSIYGHAAELAAPAMTRNGLAESSISSAEKIQSDSGGSNDKSQRTSSDLRLNSEGVAQSWNLAVAALAHNDKAAALDQFVDRTKYDEIFTAMGNRLSDLAASMGEMQVIEIAPTYATAVVMQTYNGTTLRHYVSFLYIGGAWRIADF